MGRERVLLADDHELVVAAFVTLLAPYFDVVGTVSDGYELLSTAMELKPDVIVIDIGMPRLNGIDAGRHVKATLPNTKLVVVTMNESPNVAAKALQTWASGYLLKNSAGSELIKAIREVLRGNSYVTPRVAQQLEDRFVRDPRPDYTSELTPRQREVLQLLAEGKNMIEVAHILGISRRTVAFHKYSIMDDFGLKTNADLLHLAIREHIVETQQ
jgi:DNA-binding NarL/FixJ family response regulator